MILDDLLQPGERVVSTVTKHWFVLFSAVAGTIFAGLLPFLLLGFVSSTSGIPAGFGGLISFASLVWLLIIWISLAAVSTNFYLDYWIITDRRLIDIDQESLFWRKDSTTRLERIEDIVVTQHGFIETMLNFGSIMVETAGAEPDALKMDGIADPHNVRRIMSEQMDRHIGEKYENPNKEYRPSRGAYSDSTAVD